MAFRNGGREGVLVSMAAQPGRPDYPPVLRVGTAGQFSSTLPGSPAFRRRPTLSHRGASFKRDPA